MSLSTFDRLAYLAGDLTPSDLVAFHRARFGDAQMNGDDDGGNNESPSDSGSNDSTPQRPDGVSDDEWNALGDPGRRVLARERDRANRAERDLAAVRSLSAQQGKKDAPKPTPPPGKQASEQPKGVGNQPDPGDLNEAIAKAVEAALRPLMEREQQREAEDGARRVADAVTKAAGGRLHDPADALAYLDLAELTDGSGSPDAAKVSAALDDLAKRKPHLVKVADDRRRPAPGSFIGGAAPAPSTDEQVKASLRRMQSAAGVKLAGDST